MRKVIVSVCVLLLLSGCTSTTAPPFTTTTSTPDGEMVWFIGAGYLSTGTGFHQPCNLRQRAPGPIGTFLAVFGEVDDIHEHYSDDNVWIVVLDMPSPSGIFSMGMDCMWHPSAVDDDLYDIQVGDTIKVVGRVAEPGLVRPKLDLLHRHREEPHYHLRRRPTADADDLSTLVTFDPNCFGETHRAVTARGDGRCFLFHHYQHLEAPSAPSA